MGHDRNHACEVCGDYPNATGHKPGCAVKRWAVKLAEMKANRVGRCPRDIDLEDSLCKEMEVIFEEMTPDERVTVERPEPPIIRNSIIAQNEDGSLIGYEDR